MDLIEVENKTEIVDIESVIPNAWNPNIQTNEIYEKELESLKRYGQIAPILVREQNGVYELIDGEHRLRGMKQLGYKKILIFDAAGLSESDAKQLTIIMNEVRGRADSTKLSKLFQELSLDVPLEELTKIIPYSDVEMRNMVAQAHVDWDAIAATTTSTSKQKEGEEDWKTIEIRVPTELKEQFEELILRFKKLLYPDDEPKNVSIVMPFEAMLQVINQTPDNEILGG